MKLRRLRIANFRGVTGSEVTFDDGVTVVEGPNEVGKSSLAEALLLLLDPGKKSDSRSKDVERVRPIGRDEVPEVEAEFEAGPYRFTFQKRFTHKKGGGTELDVRSPKAEQHAGDAAMQRFEQILRETLDVDLFRALCVEQGRAVGQAALGGKTWLTRALDDAAGGDDDADDGRHESLFDRVRKRYLEYYTEKTGNPTRELSAAVKAALDAKDWADELQTRATLLDAMVAEHGTLTAELRDLDRRLPQFEVEAKAARAAVDALVEVERRAAQTAERAAAQGARVDKLQADADARHQLVAAIAEAEGELEPKTARVATLAGHVEATRGLRDAAAAALRAATRDREAAEIERAAARSDVERLAHLARRDVLRARRGKAQAHRERIEVLDAQVRDGIPDGALAQLEQLERDAQRARDALRTSGARLSIEALRDLDLQVDGGPPKLPLGATFEPEPGAPVDLTVPDVLRVRLQVGAGTEELQAAAEAAEARLRELQREVGVPDVATARTRADAARAAGYELEAARSQLAELGEGLEIDAGASVVDALDVEIRALQAADDRLRDARPADRAEPRDAAHAGELLVLAEAAEAQARGDEARARADLETATAAFTEAEKEHLEHQVDLRGWAQQLTDQRARLDAARSAQADDALDAELAGAKAASEALQTDERALRDRLAAADLGAKRLLADNAEEALAGLRTRRGDLEGRRAQIDAVLRHEEGDGLGEKLQQAQAELEHATQHHAQVERRARAAKLLFETMTDARAAAQAARVQPLTDRLERLGRIAFNDTFRATLAPDLTIEDRTLDGLTVPFDDLSVGAREQLDLLMRIAVAQAVEAHGGVPLILDDTLGNADPGRLAKMNALLALAGREVQVIVLTCHPERFARVGGARTVRLTAGGA